jgi:minor curlin subunit
MPMIRVLSRLHAPVVLLFLVAGVPDPGAAQQAGGGEAYVTQAGSNQRPAGRAAAIPMPATDLLTTDWLFYDPALLRTGASAAGSILGQASLTGNTAIVHQEGDGNIARIEQRGVANTASISQRGDANRASIVQRGDDNRTSAFQSGVGNTFAASFLGSRNAFTFVQEGERNRYTLDFLGDRLTHQVTQRGTGLSAVQLGFGSLPFTIQQQGHGMEVIVQHDPIVR